MQITEVITVHRDPDAVWELFNDVEGLSQCLPGAELTEDKGEGNYAGRVVVKLGPLTATFEGEAKVEADDAARSGIVNGRGVDRRGGSRGQVKVEYRLEEVSDGTKVSVDADVHLSGAAAQFGRVGLINEMSGRLINEFVECLEAKLAAETVEEAAQVQAAEVQGIALFFQSLLAWIRRLFQSKD